MTSLPSWASEAVCPGKVRTLCFFTGGLSSDPHPRCSLGSPFGLEAFIQSDHTYSDLSPSILVTPLPLFSEGISDLAEGGVGPHAGRHLPRAHAGADSDEVHLHQSVRVSQDPCGTGKVVHLTVSAQVWPVCGDRTVHNLWVP